MLRARLSEPRVLATIAIGAALVLFTALAVLRVFATSAFFPDESSHIDYALKVTSGEIPRIGARVYPELPGQPRALQYESNHPPLYHLIAGALIRTQLHSGDPDRGLYLARLLSVLLAVATIVVLVAICASFGMQRRLLVTATAAGIAATFNPFILGSTLIANDSIVALCAACAVLAVVRIIRFGFTWWRYVGLCLAMSAGMLAKVSMVVALATCAGVLALALAIRDGPVRRRIGEGAAAAAGAIVVAALASGWFYLKNHARYGSFTGSSVVQALFRARAHEPSSATVVQYLSDPGSWWTIWQQGFGGGYARRMPDAWWSRSAGIAGAVLVIWAVTCIAIHWWRRRERSSGPRDVRATICRLLIPATLALPLIGSILEIASHVVVGGAPHARYLLPGLVGYCVILAVVLLVPLARTAVVAVAFIALQFVGAVVGGAAVLKGGKGYGVNWWDAYQVGLRANGLHGAIAPVLLALTFVAFAVLSASIVALSRAQHS